MAVFDHFVQVIIVTHHRSWMVKDCIESVLKAFSFSKDRNWSYHIYVGCNADPQARQELEDHFSGQSNIYIVFWENHLSPAVARNRLLEKTQSGWVLFLDDDTCVPVNYFEVMSELETKAYSVVGGPNLSFKNSSRSEQLQSLVLGSRSLAGPFADRYSRRNTGECKGLSRLILCNLWILQTVKRKIRFNEFLLSGEENELLERLSECRFFYCRDLFVYHHRRESLEAFAHQVFRFGYGRGQCLQRKSSLTWLKLFIGSAKMMFIVLSPLVLCWLLFSSFCLWIRNERQFKYQEIFNYSGVLVREYLLGVLFGFQLRESQDLKNFNGRVPLRSSL